MHKSKKLVLTFSLITLYCICSLSILAQNPSNYYVEEPKLFNGGLVAGMNMCQVDGDKYAGYFKYAPNLGATLYMNLANNISLSLELLYTEKGAKSNFRQNSSSKIYTIISQKINLSYVEIPLLFNISDKRNSKVGLGMSYAQLINGDEKISTNPVSNYDASKYPFLKSDFSFIASGNLHLFKGWYGNLRFQYSLLPIRKNVDYEFARAQQYNNLWTVRIMYLF